ncbi:unnamed protein product [Ilex paraguariensis]|uniref:Uncharacterized protein n=1 Tax=Ilex paraguariensis TaxID=185542 RepID=A0ABC8QS58_9AQUA
MEGMQQLALPIVGIVAVAAVTFYAVSFAELREVPILSLSHMHILFFMVLQLISFLNLQKSFRDLDESEESENMGFKSSLSSRERRARRKAEKEAKS